MDASAKNFKAQERTPSVDRIAEVYRNLNMAAVVFTVDAPHPAPDAFAVQPRWTPTRRYRHKHQKLSPRGNVRPF
jgi:hypothetical protein